MAHFPNVLAAVAARETHLKNVESADVWAICDALVADLGLDVEGLRAKLTACASEIKRQGYKSPSYAVGRLADMRNAAITFPRSRRYRQLPFETHREASNPNFLDWIIEKKGLDISVREVAALRTQWRHVEKQQREEEHRKAKEALTKAETEKEKAKATKRVKETKTPPPKNNRPTRRQASQMAELADQLAIEGDLERARGLLEQSLQRLRALSSIHPDYHEGFVDECDSIIKLANQIKDRLAGRPTVSVIQGGKSA
jgi:hypothetical protein